MPKHTKCLTVKQEVSWSGPTPPQDPNYRQQAHQGKNKLAGSILRNKGSVSRRFRSGDNGPTAGVSNLRRNRFCTREHQKCRKRRIFLGNPPCTLLLTMEHHREHVGPLHTRAREGHRNDGNSAISPPLHWFKTNLDNNSWEHMRGGLHSPKCLQTFQTPTADATLIDAPTTCSWKKAVPTQLWSTLWWNLLQSVLQCNIFK